jgi:hypothetical protein
MALIAASAALADCWVYIGAESGQILKGGPGFRADGFQGIRSFRADPEVGVPQGRPHAPPGRAALQAMGPTFLGNFDPVRG